MATLRELESQNEEYLGAKWCRQCGRVYPHPGHTPDCVLSQYVPEPEEEVVIKAPRATRELGKNIKDPENGKQED